MVKSQNIYEYKQIKPIVFEAGKWGRLYETELSRTHRILINKINETVSRQNKLGKDLELYKKAYKRLYTLVQGVTNE